MRGWCWLLTLCAFSIGLETFWNPSTPAVAQTAQDSGESSSDSTSSPAAGEQSDATHDDDGDDHAGGHVDPMAPVLLAIIIVLFVALLPALGAEGKHLYRVEIAGLNKEGLRPRIQEAALVLWKIYAILSLVEAVFLMLAGLNLFDALCQTFGTVATGGFSTRNASIGAFDSLYIETVIMIFMLVSGISFTLHYRLYVRGDWRSMVRSSEVRLYLAIFVLFTLVITGALLAGRNYTVFAGHHHRYGKWLKNGNRYFRLATTGGQSALAGPEAGQFDHVMWVTMTTGGPVVCNLLLDGILDEDAKSNMPDPQAPGR